jgi:N-acetylneuraminic acid mutarotase
MTSFGRVSRPALRGVLSVAALVLAVPGVGMASTSWRPTSTVGAPSPRINHTAFWTGSHMLVWGGWDWSGPAPGRGGRYDPTTNTWSKTTLVGAPMSRERHTAVWTGSRMIVWGGFDGFETYWNDGAIYDPAADAWTPVAAEGAPGARASHTAVWTGSKMIVWGGHYWVGGHQQYTIAVNTGGIYDPATDTWTPMTTVGAPEARVYHTAVWTGSKMIVWGGIHGDAWLDTGGIYDPATDTWTPTSTVGSPGGRVRHSSVWTGSRMIIWGGQPLYPEDDPAAGVLLSRSGRLYDPGTDTWTEMSPATNALIDHSTVWTGTRMIVWGGWTWDAAGISRGRSLSTGSAYDPARDTWTPLAEAGAPEPRGSHSAVWTGTSMIVWGGAHPDFLATGGVLEVRPSLDLDGDRRSDVLWRHESGALHAWLTEGLAIRSAGPLPGAGPQWVVRAVHDLDGDTRADILWREAESGLSYVWLMDGTMVRGAGFTSAQADPSWSFAGAADFDGDGRGDLLWRHSSGLAYVWLMDGATVRAGSGSPGGAPSNWSIDGAGDVDGDGRAEIVWRESASGSVYVWHLDGAALTSGEFATSTRPPSWTLAGLGDVDGDFRDDLIWRDADGALEAWADGGLGGAGTVVTLGSVPPEWRIEALGDYDGNLQADVLWRDEASGSTYLWMTEGRSVAGQGFTAEQADPSWTVQPE